MEPAYKLLEEVTTKRRFLEKLRLRFVNAQSCI